MYIVKPQLEVWSDLNPKFIKDSQGAIKKDVNLEAVKGSIDNILHTSPGERVMLPTFAASFRSLLFEPINNRLLNRLSETVKIVIERWDDRVSVETVAFQVDPDKNTISMDLIFKIKGFFETLSYNTIFKV